MYDLDNYAAVRRFVFIEGHSQREAARVFGLARKTIGKMCRFSAPPGYQRIKPIERPTLGPFIGVIDAILSADKQAQLASVKLLIIDELGYVPLSPTGAELLFEVFSQRYERGATIVTSNLPFVEWTSVLGSERLTGALLDRLTHHVHILEMNGESYRLKQACDRRREAIKAETDAPAPERHDRSRNGRDHLRLTGALRTLLLS